MKLFLATAALAACLAIPLTSALTTAIAPDGKASDDADMLDPVTPRDNEGICSLRTFHRGKYDIANNHDLVFNGWDSHCTNVTKLLNGMLSFIVSFNLKSTNFGLIPNTEINIWIDPVPLNQIESIKSSMKFTINHDDATDLIVYYTMNLFVEMFSIDTVITVWLEVVGKVTPYDYQKIRDGVKVQNLEFDLYKRVDENSHFILYLAKKVPRNLEIDLNLFILHYMNWDVSKSSLKLGSATMGTKAYIGSSTVTVHNYNIDVITKT